MVKAVVLSIGILMASGCTPKEAHRELQTFSPITIDMVKIDTEDYSELITAVNAAYSPDNKEFNDARLFKEEGTFTYFHIYSGSSTACYRVTVDKNRGRIINMQPDCAIEE
jgi:hypothetical protein